LPRRYTEAGLRRYGFHGLSYEHVASVLPSLDGGSAFERTVVAHLGRGQHVCPTLHWYSTWALVSLSFQPSELTQESTQVPRFNYVTS